MDAYYRSNHDFHTRLQAIAANRWLDRATNELRGFLRLLRGRQLNHDGRLGESVAEHRELVEAIERGDARRAEQLMHDHLMAQLEALRALRASEAQAGAAAAPAVAVRSPSPLPFPNPPTEEPAVLDELRQVARRASSEHALRKLLADCRSLLSERGEANSVAIAAIWSQRLNELPEDMEAPFFDAWPAISAPTRARCSTAAQAYAAQPDAQTQMRLTAVAEPVRQELFRRINRAPGGTAAVLRLRRALLGRLRSQKHLRAVEADLFHLLSSWFNPGFLEMRKVDWNSPARLLEKVIRARGGARGRRLGRPAPPARARPPAVRLLPSAAAATSR